MSSVSVLPRRFFVFACFLSSAVAAGPTPQTHRQTYCRGPPGLRQTSGSSCGRRRVRASSLPRTSTGRYLQHAKRWRFLTTIQSTNERSSLISYSDSSWLCTTDGLVPRCDSLWSDDRIPMCRAAWEDYLRTAITENKPYDSVSAASCSRMMALMPRLDSAAKFFLDRDLEPDQSRHSRSLVRVPWPQCAKRPVPRPPQRR